VNPDPRFVEELAGRGKRPPPPLSEAPRHPVDNLKKPLQISVSVHALLVVAVLVAPWVESFFYRITGKSRPISAEDLRSAIRVDVVDLPRAKLDDLQKLDLSLPVDPKLEQPVTGQDEKPVAEVPAVPSPTAMVDPTQDSSQSRIEALRQSLRKRTAADDARQKAIARLQKKSQESGGGRPEVAGNILSEGYSLTGDVAQDRDVYVGKALAHLRKVWEIPAWMRASNLSARVVVRLAPDGRILSKEFVQSSGQVEFDAAVKRTLEAADPFPPPPESLARDVMEGGIGWAFPL